MELHSARENGNTEDHPYVKAVDDMMEAFGGQWPPRPKFSDWPAVWTVYARLCDDAPEQIFGLNDAAKFRLWIEDRLHKEVGL